jgi:hypothetical protein
VTWWGDRASARVLVRGALLHKGDSIGVLMEKIDSVHETEPERTVR